MILRSFLLFLITSVAAKRLATPNLHVVTFRSGRLNAPWRVQDEALMNCGWVLRELRVHSELAPLAATMSPGRHQE